MKELATYEGNSLGVLLEDIFREVLSLGRFCCVLDFPFETFSPTTPPHTSTFDADHIPDYKLSVVNGQQVLAMLRLHEDDDELDECVEQHLVLTLEPA